MRSVIDKLPSRVDRARARLAEQKLMAALEASSQQAAQLTEEQNTGRAEQQSADGRETVGEVRYSIGRTSDGREVAVVDSDILSHIDTSNWDKGKKAAAKRAAKDALLSFADGVRVDTARYKINKISRNEFTYSTSTEKLYRKDKARFADKMRMAEVADDIITATTAWARDGELVHPRTDNFVDFIHGDVLVLSGSNQYVAKTVVGVTDGGEYVFYDVVDLEPTIFQMKEEPSSAAADNEVISNIQENSSKQSVPHPAAKSNPQNEDGQAQYSIKGSERAGELAELERENQRLKEQAEYWFSDRATFQDTD